MPWHVVFTSQSQQGIRAAILAGLAITVLARDDVEPGMVRLRSRLEAEPQLRVRMLGSAEELEAQRRRMKQQKDAYRASVDWVSKEELANMRASSKALKPHS